MDVVARYLARLAEVPQERLPPPSPGLRLVVVIPALAEADNIGAVLDSLGKPDDHFEILVVVNRPRSAPAEVVDNNHRILRQLAARRVLAIERVYPDELAGVGAARRSGMDCALRRLVTTGNLQWGAIACLDADSPVSPGYAEKLLEIFSTDDAPAAAVCQLHHPLPEDDPVRARAIATYELWLRYLQAGFALCGSPYAFIPVGSCLVVSARAYAAAQGMPRRQAAEDFHFLQKLVKTAGGERVASLRQPLVFPAPRLSRRVPFGTGRAMLRCRELGPDTYRWVEPARAFFELRDFFAAAPDGYRHPEQLRRAASTRLQDFLAGYGFPAVLERLRANSPGPGGFTRQLHTWFDALRIVRYSRLCRTKYGSSDVLDALDQCGFGRRADVFEALEYMRGPGDPSREIDRPRSAGRSLPVSPVP